MTEEEWNERAARMAPRHRVPQSAWSLLCIVLLLLGIVYFVPWLTAGAPIR